jgi:molecular chaperone GrpE
MLKKIEENVISLIRETAFLKEEIGKRENEHHDQLKKLLLSMVEILDDFDRKFINIGSRLEQADEQTRIWINYFKSTRKLLWLVMKERGVSEIETLGIKAIPGYHFILDVVSRPGMEDETIVEEMKKGYFWKKEVLRKAEVITVKNI